MSEALRQRGEVEVKLRQPADAVALPSARRHGATFDQPYQAGRLAPIVLGTVGQLDGPPKREYEMEMNDRREPAPSLRVVNADPVSMTTQLREEGDTG